MRQRVARLGAWGRGRLEAGPVTGPAANAVFAVYDQSRAIDRRRRRVRLAVAGPATMLATAFVIYAANTGFYMAFGLGPAATAINGPRVMPLSIAAFAVVVVARHATSSWPTRAAWVRHANRGAAALGAFGVATFAASASLHAGDHTARAGASVSTGPFAMVIPAPHMVRLVADRDAPQDLYDKAAGLAGRDVLLLSKFGASGTWTFYDRTAGEWVEAHPNLFTHIITSWD